MRTEMLFSKGDINGDSDGVYIDYVRMSYESFEARLEQVKFSIDRLEYEKDFLEKSLNNGELE